MLNRDRWRMAKVVGGAAVCVAILQGVAGADEVPLELRADEVFVSSDQSRIEARGSVEVELRDVRLSADALELTRGSDGAWRFDATGAVEVTVEDGVSAFGDRLSGVIGVEQDAGFLRSVEAEGFGGESRFVNTQDEEQTIFFRGTSGRITFDEAGEPALIEVFDAEVTTCDCCGLPFRSQPYTLRAKRLQLYPDRLLVVFGLTARLGGVAAFWLPVYAQPLEETLESPLFPAFGRSSLRGWYLKWNVPYFVSESLYGSLLFDYYSAYDEIATGIVTRYAFLGHEGQFRIYRFPAKIGDSIFEFSASHDLPVGTAWAGRGSVDYKVVGGTTKLDYGAQAVGSSGGWTIDISAAREIDEENTDDEDPSNDVTKTTDRVPEISIAREPWDTRLASIAPRIELGRYLERVGDESAVSADRLGGGVDVTMEPVTWGELLLSPSLDLQANTYFGEGIAQSRGSAHLQSSARWRGARATYELLLVRGESPFEFDAEETTHHLGLDIHRTGELTLGLSCGIDLGAGIPDPIVVDVGFRLGADWNLTATYDLSEAALDAVGMAGDWAADSLRLAWSIPYLPGEGRFDPISMTIDASGKGVDLEIDATLDEGRLTVDTDLSAEWSIEPLVLQGSVNFSDLALSAASVTATLTTDAGWGGRIAWSYDGGTLSWADLRYGLFWDVGECLRIGLDREASETWVYLSILAFPEAIIRYAPASTRVEAGTKIDVR